MRILISLEMSDDIMTAAMVQLCCAVGHNCKTQAAVATPMKVAGCVGVVLALVMSFARTDAGGTSGASRCTDVRHCRCCARTDTHGAWWRDFFRGFWGDHVQSRVTFAARCLRRSLSCRPSCT